MRISVLLAIASTVLTGALAVASELEPIQPVPEPAPVRAEVAALGRRLFLDSRLSGDGTISCESCHHLDGNGADEQVLAIGIGGKVGKRNTPTVFDAALNPYFFWDARAATLEDQVNDPLLSPIEMASSWPEVVAKLSGDASYRSEFAEAFPDGITAKNVRSAIASFERTLVFTGNCFDKFLHGDTGAISDDARAGYQRFKSYGCVSCHQGRNVGGNLLEEFGVMDDESGSRTRFRVAPLRFAARTAPYFHDGSAATLDEAIVTMARVQIGEKIPPQERKQIARFIQSLSEPCNER